MYYFCSGGQGNNQTLASKRLLDSRSIYVLDIGQSGEAGQFFRAKSEKIARRCQPWAGSALPPCSTGLASISTKATTQGAS